MEKYLECMRRIKEDKGYFNKVCLQDFSQPHLPIFGNKNTISSWYREGTFHVGVLAPAFRKKKERSACLSCVCYFSMPLTQSNAYAKVVYFGETYSATFHLHKQTRCYGLKCVPPKFIY